VIDRDKALESAVSMKAVAEERKRLSHSSLLIQELTSADFCTRLHLLKDFGETKLEGSTLFNTPKWNWPNR
jgi:hypothetical protein